MTTALRTGLLVAIALVAPSASAWAQLPSTERDEEPLRRRAAGLGAIFRLTASGVFDTNVDHDDDDIDSYGGVMSARLGLRLEGASIEYRLGVNRFTNSSRWNRTTHRVVARFSRALQPDLLVDGQADIALQHASEDREIGNYYTVQPRVTYEIDDDQRLRARVRYRMRRSEERPTSNATRTEAGLEYEQRFGRAHRATVEVRYQQNESTLARERYEGGLLEAEYRGDVGRRSEVVAGLEFRQLTYADRLVGADPGAARRHDDRWVARLSWVQKLGGQTEWRVDYELERRLSNEPGKTFRAHRLGWSVSWAID